MQGGQGRDWGYLVLMDRLDERYDNLKAPESLGKNPITRKGGQRGDSARVGDQCLSDLGQWSHYLPRVGGDPPGKYPNLQTHKSVWPEKLVYEENQQQGRLALGFEKSISQI